MVDYSKSAVNLCNPGVIEIKLFKYRELQSERDTIQDKIKSLVPQELQNELELKESSLNTLNQEIKASIDELGSYQNLDNGMTAVKQRKVSKSYDAEKFDSVYPDYSKAVIVKAIDTTKLAGLIKGGLIKEEELKSKSILKETETFAYIIK
jgi:hypothetical protein